MMLRKRFRIVLASRIDSPLAVRPTLIDCMRSVVTSHGLSSCWRAIGAGWIRRKPRARGVDNRVGLDGREDAAAFERNLKGRILPSRRLHLVETLASDGRYSRLRSNRARQIGACGKRR